MSKTIEVPIPIRIDKLTEIMRFKGVPIYVHWSVLVIAVLILINVVHHPASSVLGLASYLGVLLIHEIGHLVAAQRLGCHVISIRLYPIFGITEFSTPWSRFDHCLIAWGGVIAQTVVALPIVAWVGFFGYTRHEAVNAVLALLGFFSVGVAIFNLLPVPPLDGSVAWAIFPESFRRFRKDKSRRSGSLRY